MGSRCPPGVDRLVFGLIGRRCFGGRGELRSPLSPHRNAPSGHSGVAHGLFYDQAILWLDLQNAHAPGSLRSPSDAAPECFFKNIPVFRSAYFPIPHRPTFGAPVFRSAYSASRNARASAAFAASIKPYYGLCSKTLGLQVRSAHPPMPHRNVFSKLSGVPLGLFGKPKRSSSSRFAASGGRGELLL